MPRISSISINAYLTTHAFNILLYFVELRIYKTHFSVESYHLNELPLIPQSLDFETNKLEKQ